MGRKTRAMSDNLPGLLGALASLTYAFALSALASQILGSAVSGVSEPVGIRKTRPVRLLTSLAFIAFSIVLMGWVWRMWQPLDEELGRSDGTIWGLLHLVGLLVPVIVLFCCRDFLLT